MTPKGPILITGAAGFIGSQLVKAYEQASVEVISVDQLDHFQSRPEHREIEFGQKIDRKELFTWLAKKAPKLSGIVHLGACTDTTELDRDFLLEVNTEYSKRIWTYASESRIPLVYASSAATYGDGALGYDDDETLMSKLKPLNPYGESKLLFDLWALDQENQGQRPPAWSGFKFFNVYGFGERHKDKMASVVVHAFDQIQKDGRVKLFRSHRSGIADGEQKRDFIYVEDVVTVLRFALETPIDRGIFNLGTGQARTFLDLVRAVFSNLNRPEKIEFIDTPIEIRDRYQYFTEAKMDRLRKAGYKKPFTSLEKGVAEYILKLNN